MSSSRKKILEIILIVMISFSPLGSNTLKSVITLMLVILNIKKLQFIRVKEGSVLFFVLGIFIISAIYDFRNITDIGQISILNLYFPLCFVLGFIISQKYTITEYLYYLEKVIFVAAAFSLMGVFIYTFLPGLVYSLPSYSYYHTVHKTAYIFNILLVDGGILNRNAGIAWEPGVFQFLLSIGVNSYIKLNKKKNILKVAVYGLAIIFTKSTAGLIIFMIITFNIFRKDKVARWFIILLIMVFMDTIVKEFNYQYQYKLFGSYAFETRLEPTINAIKLGMDNILGLGNTGYELKYKLLGVGAWDSYGQILIRYGYILLFAIIALLLRVFKYDRMLFLILIITFFSQGIWFFPIVTPLYFAVNKKSNTEKGV